MSNSVVVYENVDQVRADLDKARQSVMEVLPSRVDADRFLRVITKAVIESPKLMQCTRLSLLAAVHEAAQLGLEPTGLLGSAYLVPYRMRREVNGKWQTVNEVKLIPGYRGLIDLARRGGEISAIQAELVRKRDVFDYQPARQPNPIIHIPFIPDPTAPIEDRDRGPVVGAYMLATLRDGFVQPEWMTYDEIEAVRKGSKAADDGPWVNHWDAMARKTPVRRGSKFLPLSPSFLRALELEEEAEREAIRLPDAVRPVNRAAQMLIDRAASATGTAQGDSQDPEAVEVTPDGSSEAPGASTEAPDECEAVNADLGQCQRLPGHDGVHANEEGRWPQ